MDHGISDDKFINRAKNAEPEGSTEKPKILSGIIPICASCKKISDDTNCWKPIDEYFQDHLDIQFTHGLCPECGKKLYPDYY